MTETASRARLVLASATIAPNWTISGSFWNCGAPPDREIAVAIVEDAHDGWPTSVAANAAIQSAAPGRPANAPRPWKIASVDRRDEREVGEVEGELDGRLARGHEHRHARADRTARRYSSGVKKKSPATAGISLSENEWVSRRKWTTMTFVSAARKATASNGHGNGTGSRRAEGGGRSSM